MRLIELAPRWTGDTGESYGAPHKKMRYGLTFLCPHCRGIRLAVFFKPFIDPDGVAQIIPWRMPGAPNPNTGVAPKIEFWSRNGDTFETLSLEPSVDTNVAGHWHGFIRRGEVL